MQPALQTLLNSASEAGEIRADVDPDDLLHAVAQLCMATDTGPSACMVDLLTDGLRYGAAT